MKEVFRGRDHALVGYYKTLLESEGIPIMMRNEYASTGITEIPIPEFFPNICVMNNDDYEKARGILDRVINKNSELEITCPSCSELNPGNFEVCYACNTNLPADSSY